MINFFAKAPRILKGLILGLIILFALPNLALGKEPKRYKKQTQVDFEDALIEGKSRKPYSAYLTQQRNSAFSELHSWKFNTEAGAAHSAARLEYFR